MKKYIKPVAEVEKFTVVDVITESTTDSNVTVDKDIFDFDESVAPSAGDEF